MRGERGGGLNHKANLTAPVATFIEGVTKYAVMYPAPSVFGKRTEVEPAGEVPDGASEVLALYS